MAAVLSKQARMPSPEIKQKWAIRPINCQIHAYRRSLHPGSANSFGYVTFWKSRLAVRTYGLHNMHYYD